MKLILTTACAAALLGGGILTAADRNSADRNSQDPAKARKEVVQDVKTTTDSGHNQNHDKYRLGQGGSLHETLNVAPDLKVGDWVKAQEKTDYNGHKTLTVEHANEQASQ